MTESDIAVLVERIDNLKAQVGVSNNDANEWRNRFMDKMNTLPCEARIEGTKSIRHDIGWLQKIIYGVLWVGIPALIGLAVIWGALRNDVERIKETSYGYRGIKVVTDGSSDWK